MYNPYDVYQNPYYGSMPYFYPNSMYDAYRAFQCPYCCNLQMKHSDLSNESEPLKDDQEESRADEDLSDNSERLIQLKDYGPQPFVINITEATRRNNNYRTALWTGKYLQATLMSIKVGDDIGLEIHPNTDQFIRIEEGQGLVKMGSSKNRLTYQRKVRDDFAVFIPAGTWHNIINTGNKPLKLYSIYAPPHHPFGTVHKTKKDAQASE